MPLQPSTSAVASAPGDPAAINGHAPPLRLWGFWMTLAWFVASYLSAAVVYPLAEPLLGTPATGTRADYLTVMIALGAQIVVIAAAIRWRRWRFADYLAISRPRLAHVAIGVAVLAVIFVVKNALAILFQTGSADTGATVSGFALAGANGTAPLLVIWAVIIGPLNEELLFRGFLYRGWAATRLGAVGTIVLVSLLFGLVHGQYTWFGMLGTGLNSLAYTTMRWHSRTVAVPLAMHVIHNLLVMVYAASQSG